MREMSSLIWQQSAVSDASGDARSDVLFVNRQSQNPAAATPILQNRHRTGILFRGPTDIADHMNTSTMGSVRAPLDNC